MRDLNSQNKNQQLKTLIIVGAVTALAFCVTEDIFAADPASLKIVDDFATAVKTSLQGKIKTAIQGGMALAGGWGFYSSKSVTPLLMSAGGIGVLEFLLTTLA